MDHLLSSSRGFGPGELTSSCPYTGITLQGNSERVSRNSEAAYHALNVASNVLIHSQLSSSASFLFHHLVVCLIIVHSSKSGSSEKYALALSRKTGLPAYSVYDDYPKDQCIVFFGWVKGPSIVGIRSIDRSKLHAVCAVGLDSADRFDSMKMSDSNGVSVPMYYVRGWIDRSRLGIIDKAILAVVAVFMKLQGLNQFNQPVFDAMMDGGSFYDESQLEPLTRFCSGKDPSSD